MITKQEIENIALLSKLYVAEEEYDKLTEDMGRMVSFAHAISEADVSPVKDTLKCESANVYREDEVVSSLLCEEILRNAPEQRDSCFLLRKRV